MHFIDQALCSTVCTTSAPTPACPGADLGPTLTTGMAWQPHTPAAQQLAAIKSQTTTHLAYHVDDSPNAHHHIANGLGEVAYGRQLHNCQEAVAHSYWRALAPDPQAAASAYARKRPGERHKFIQGRYFEEEEDVEFNCTTPLQPVSLTGNYELTEAQIHPVQQQWADKQSAEGAVRAMDWLSLEAEILELDADDGSWEVLSSSRCVAHHNFIIDQVHSNLWSSTVAEHVSTFDRGSRRQ